MDGRTGRLNERFGLSEFRPWQREAIDALLDEHRPVLVVAPTGGGKSLCYQFPATELPGVTLVISPLIALMEDQVRALEQRGVAATYLASTLPLEEQRKRARRAACGDYKLVYVAPERLANPYALHMLEGLRPRMVAIDEAHCISQWGHDFRPDYLRLGAILQHLAPEHVLACTATATPRVRDEILDRLGFDRARARVVLRGFARPNLHLTALEVDAPKDRRQVMLAAVERGIGKPGAVRGAAIVYGGTRKTTDQLADLLRTRGYRADAYHAGLAPEQRAEVNRAFVTGERDVVAATNAFGMGIDRADIRVVVHVNAPGSIEAYYQEVGRAGRDGRPSHGLLLTGASDLGLRRRLIELGASGARVDQQWALFLDLMRYVEAGSCRHDFILRYFDDEEELLGGCGHCDVCERLEHLGGVERTTPEEDLLVVRKALSGVARVQGRAGMRNISEMLKGKTSKKLETSGLDRLTTFGLLREHSVDWVLSLLRRLVTAGLMEVSADDYPMPYLTALGIEVMKGEKPARVLLPPEDVGKRRSSRGRAETARRTAPTSELSPASQPLFEALREVRLKLARDKGVPPYVVCHDRTLVGIAERRPGDEAALSEVHGMGPARVASYGEELLRVVREFGNLGPFDSGGLTA